MDSIGLKSNDKFITFLLYCWSVWLEKTFLPNYTCIMLNRLGVVRTVLQTASSLPGNFF